MNGGSTSTDYNMFFDTELTTGTGLTSAECDLWDASLRCDEMHAFSHVCAQLDTIDLEPPGHSCFACDLEQINRLA